MTPVQPIAASLMVLVVGLGLVRVDPSASPGAPAAASDPTHVVVWKQPGRYGGWPANHGIWSWGNETYGYRAPPFGIRARLSRDGGRTWEPERTLRADASDWDLGYTRSVQRADGKIVTVYYYNDASVVERYIAATIWDPDA